MIRRGLEDIEIAARAFGRKIAALAAAGIDTGLAFRRLEWRQVADQMPCQRRLPFAIVQIERADLQRLVGNCLDPRIRILAAKLVAGVVAFADQFQPRRLGFLDLMAEHHQQARQIIEQRVEAVIEQWQPMLHALRLAAGADAFVQRIIPRWPEGRDIAGAKPADGIGAQAALRWPAAIRSAPRCPGTIA